MKKNTAKSPLQKGRQIVLKIENSYTGDWIDAALVLALATLSFAVGYIFAFRTLLLAMISHL